MKNYVSFLGWARTKSDPHPPSSSLQLRRWGIHPFLRHLSTPQQLFIRHTAVSGIFPMWKPAGIHGEIFQQKHLQWKLVCFPSNCLVWAALPKLTSCSLLILFPTTRAVYQWKFYVPHEAHDCHGEGCEHSLSWGRLAQAWTQAEITGKGMDRYSVISGNDLYSLMSHFQC